MINSVWRPIQRGIGIGQATPPPRSAWGFIKKILDDWSLLWGALLAYTVIIAIVPLFVTAFGIFGLVFSGNPSARQSIVDSIANSQSDNNTRTAVRQITDTASNNLGSDAGGIFAIGIIFSLWGGSRLFVAIDNVFTIIYRVPDRTFLRRNLIAIGMLIIFILLIVLIFIAAGVPSFLINVLPGQGGAQFGIFAAGILVSLFIAFILYMSIFYVVPNKKIKLKHIWCGALLAAILLEIFVVLFPLYIRRFMGSFLGLIGFVVIIITFFYYFALILIIGAQINAYFFERIQPFPESFGTFISKSFANVRKPTVVVPASNNPTSGPRRTPTRRGYNQYNRQ